MEFVSGVRSSLLADQSLDERRSVNNNNKSGISWKQAHTTLLLQALDNIDETSNASIGSPHSAAHLHHKSLEEERRSANYKPNIWEQNLLCSLPPLQYAEKGYKEEAEELIEQVKKMFEEAASSHQVLAQLELISSVSKLGLFNHFEPQIRQALNIIALSSKSLKNNNNNSCCSHDDLYAASLCFRLLRQYGYTVSQDMFLGFVDSNNKFISSSSSEYSAEALRELFEASNLGLDGEQILKEARLFSSQKLIRNLSEKEGTNGNGEIARRKLIDSLGVPQHWRLQWYSVRRHIDEHDCELLSLSDRKGQAGRANSSLSKLAKLNFNLIQAVHQQDLKDVTLRWWRGLGIGDKLSFARDRMVESFLLATGVVPDRHLGNLRKWLAKTIQLILIVDDVYDVYGSLPELEKFTAAIERWNFKEVQELPDCMKTCFQILDDTNKEIALEIDQETTWGWLITYYLRKAWVDFCKALLMEARWFNKGETPSLEEYLSNGWISSSGPLLAVHVIFGVTHEKEHIIDLIEASRQIVYYASLLIRLCNDEGTSAAELARGDAPSSILCHMREAGVSEEVAREHIRGLIMDAWMKINNEVTNHSLSPAKQRLVEYAVNLARIGHFMYQHGDGFGVQDRETKEEVLSNLIHPIPV